MIQIIADHTNTVRIALSQRVALRAYASFAAVTGIVDVREAHDPRYVQLLDVEFDSDLTGPRSILNAITKVPPRCVLCAVR